MKKFVFGDVVRLRSGGARMTVIRQCSFYTEARELIVCTHQAKRRTVIGIYTKRDLVYINQASRGAQADQSSSES